MKTDMHKPASKLLVLLLTFALLLTYMPQMALAVGGAYSIDFSAADPSDDGATYDKVSPAEQPSRWGRANDPLTNTGNADSVESLMPRDLALGQIVPFLFKITVNGDTMPENGIIEFTAEWLTMTTNGGNFGFDPNYKVYGAFVNTGDSQYVDPEGDATVVDIDPGSSSYALSSIVDSGTSNERIRSTIRVSGLDSGDVVIVQVWLVLKNAVPEKISGNVHTGILSAETVAETPETINVGKQTVPLNQVGTFFSADVDLDIKKLDSPDPVEAGSNVTYTITVTNTPPDGNVYHAVANGVVVTDTLDAISTYVSNSPSQGTVSVSGQTITWTVGSLLQNESATLTVTVKSPTAFTDYDTSLNPEAGGYGTAQKGAGPPARDMVNNVSVTSITNETDSANNSYFQPTNIIYKAAGSVTLEALKQLAGRTLKSGEFSFQLKEGATVLQTKQNTADGKITFSPLSYTAADIGKTFTYTISEVVGSLGGVTYDSLVITVTVKVTDAGGGKLDFDVDYSSDTTFNNTYQAAGSVTLMASKALTGRTLQAGQFSFELREGATLLDTKQNAADGKVTFSPIGYTLADVGTHTYKITEINSALPGYTYDPMELTVTVEVSDKGDGTLVIKTTYPTDTTFNNTYTASGQISLMVSKALAGRDLKAGEFSFQLKLGATVLQTKTNALDGSVNFDPIPYTEADAGKSFNYTVVEVAGSLGGVTYDSSTFTIKVDVSDDGDGTLTAIATYPQDTTFNNTYAASGSVVLEAMKQLTGRTLAAGEFSFQFKEGDAVLQTVTNAADGKVIFAALNYTQADIGKTFNYTISEIAGSESGMDYDDMVVTVEVKVTDAGDGKLSVVAKYSDDTTFNNTYAASGSIVLEAMKALMGRTLKDGEFSFQLKEGDTVLQTVTNGADGKVVFAALNYTQADIGKTFNYTISEAAGTETGMDYDDMAVTVEVKVTDAGNGKLNVVAKYSDDTTFNNTYTASGRIVLEAMKQLTGRTLTANEFSFQLKEGDTVLQTVTNDADGKVVFTALNFTQTDIGKTFSYTISETAGTEAGMDYDDMTVTVEVKVTDAGNGSLSIVAKYSDDTTFNNTYAASGSIVLEAMKALMGRTLKDGEFSFQLKEGDTVLQTVTNAADGKVVFAALDFTQADIGKTFNYTIVEAAGTESGMDYDDMAVTVEVKVTDAGDGKLSVAAKYSDDTTFNNTYTASGSIVLEAMKALLGRTLKDGEFSFDLKFGDVVSQTVTNDADGKISFAALYFSQADIGKTFNYTIIENAGAETGMTYDDMVLTVEVTVADAGNGSLSVVAKYSDDTTFNNTYAASGSIVLEAMKALLGRTLQEGEFSFQLKEGDTVLQTVTNAADGKVVFAALDFTQADIGKAFSYTISEVQGSLGGVTYDDLAIDVTVTVADAGNGSLSVVAKYSDDKTFDNTYTASGSIALGAMKDLLGRVLEANEFSFQLKEGDAVLGTAKNSDDGLVSFEPIVYSLDDVGTHTYTITEIAGSAANMNYDPLVITVKVMVSDNGDGTLTASAEYPGDVTFNNEYLAPAIDIVKTVANQTAGDPQGDLSSLEEGQTAEYQIVVTNTGNTALEHVTVMDDQVMAGTVATRSTGGTAAFADLGGEYPAIDLGTLQPGDSVTLTYTYLTQFADIARSPIINTASVSGQMPPTRAFPEGTTVTDADDAVIDVTAIPLADIGLEIKKQVRNLTMNGVFAELATGFAGDVFEYEITVTNPTLTASLSNVKLYDSKAKIGTSVVRVHDGQTLTWVDDGNGKAMLDIGSLPAGTTLVFRYQYTSVKADEDTVIENAALVKGVYKPDRTGYDDIPLEASDTAMIGIQKLPPQTGESGSNGPLAGIALVITAMAAYVIQRKLLGKI